MAVLLDSGILFAYYDRSDAWHPAAGEILENESGALLVPSAVIPEVDHMLRSRLGRDARDDFYRGFLEAHYLVVDLPQERFARVVELNRRYVDLDLGFVDAAVVALAESLGLRRIATTDRRHFEPVARELGLELLPATSPTARSRAPSTGKRSRTPRP